MIGDDSANDTIPCFDGIVLSAATSLVVECNAEKALSCRVLSTLSNVVMTEATWSTSSV